MTHLNTILTKEFLEQKLIEEKISIMQLAMDVGCTKHMIIKYCKIYDIHTEVIKERTVNDDLVGQKFGKLTVIERHENDKFGKIRWLCKCSCGRTKVINSASLKRNLSKTCGFCNRINFKGYEDISGTYWKRTKKGAIDRGIHFELSLNDVWNQYLDQDCKCALTGFPIKFVKNQDKALSQTASIDRKDSKLGYTPDNIQIIHKRLQLMKGFIPNDEFLSWCRKIYLYNKEEADKIEIDLINIKYHDK